MVNKIIDKTDLIKPEVPFYRNLDKVQGLIKLFDIKRKVILGNQH